MTTREIRFHFRLPGTIASAQLLNDIAVTGLDAMTVAYIGDTIGRPVAATVIMAACRHAPCNSPTEVLRAIEDAVPFNKP